MSDIVKELGGMFFHNSLRDADFADFLCDSWLCHGCWGRLLKRACTCRCRTQPLMQLLHISRMDCSAGIYLVQMTFLHNRLPVPGHTHTQVKITSATLPCCHMHIHI